MYVKNGLDAQYSVVRGFYIVINTIIVVLHAS